MYLKDLRAAAGIRVIVNGDKLMEFAYASSELYGWLEQNGGAPDTAMERFDKANLDLCGSLQFADKNLTGDRR